jgi:hypothetical protein
MHVSRGLGILGTVVVVGNLALSGGGVRSSSVVPLAVVFVATLLLSPKTVAMRDPVAACSGDSMSGSAPAR